MNPKASRAATWRRRFRLRGRTWAIIPLNLPDHATATTRQQAAWVKRRMRRADVGTIAECSAGLANELRRVGLHVAAARANYGGNGNVIVTKTKTPGTFYSCAFNANSGTRFLLNMARVTAHKGRTRVTVDAVHCPSTGRYKTSAPRSERAAVIRQIAQHKVGGTRVAAGDWNDTWTWVLAELHKVDNRWRYIGGHGVEHVFAISTRRLGQRTIRYGKSSDHKVTAKVRFGVKNSQGRP